MVSKVNVRNKTKPRLHIKTKIFGKTELKCKTVFHV